jgi:hypothetical protein
MNLSSCGIDCDACVNINLRASRENPERIDNLK